MLGVATIRRAELVGGPVNMALSNLSAIVQTSENRGADFIQKKAEAQGCLK